MIIKHLPNSTSPYESCGYDRIPEIAVKDQEIIIQCRIEKEGDSESIPFLQLILNDGKEAVLKGNYKRTDENGCKYYCFPIGKYNSGDRIRYRISCTAPAQEIFTKWYEFEIYKRQDFKSPYKILYREDSILLLFLMDIDKIFAIDYNLEEDKIGIKADIIQKIPDKYEELLQNVFAVEKAGYTFHIESSPFQLSIDHKNGEPLIQFTEGTHSISILADGNNYVHGISLQAFLKGNAFYGFGEKFNSVNQKGRQHKNYVFEHFTHQEEKSYLPVPFFFTEAGYGCYHDTCFPADYSLDETEGGALLTLDAAADVSNSPNLLYLFFGRPGDILKQYISLSGGCSLPPKWSFGPWMSSNGWNSQEETLEQIEKMKQYEIPATVLVLEAWSDEATFYIFNDAQYKPKKGNEAFQYSEFTFNQGGKWPDPKEMSDLLHQNNVKLILWQIPVIKHFDEECCVQHKNDEQTVIDKGYCVRNKDGTPYRITDNWFKDSLVLDFTNPEAKKWWFSKRSYLIDDLKADGFKTDGGEFIYDNDTVFYNGKRGIEMRNRYPVIYEEGYHEFLEEHKGRGNGVIFSRAGYQGSQAFPLHWAGDQKSEYTEFRAQLKAGLSAGLSGILFWGFDIAGFAGDLPTTDLYLRSSEMAAFSPVMQFHSEPRNGQFFFDSRRSWNNDRSPWNMAGVNNDPNIISIYKKYANIRMNLIPYIYNEALYCCKEGRPMLGHLILDYPEDTRIINIEDEYMFGRSLLVAPVIYEGAVSRNVYLPEGTWYDFWNGKKYVGGHEYIYSCPLENIPVFVKEGSAIPLNLSEKLQLGDFIGNDLAEYKLFTIKLFGDQGALEFNDDIGNHFVMRWIDKNCSVSGDCNIKNIHYL